MVRPYGFAPPAPALPLWGLRDFAMRLEAKYSLPTHSHPRSPIYQIVRHDLATQQSELYCQLAIYRRSTQIALVLLQDASNFRFATVVFPGSSTASGDVANVLEVDGQTGEANPIVDAAPHVDGLQIVLDAGQGRLYLLKQSDKEGQTNSTSSSLKTDDSTMTATGAAIMENVQLLYNNDGENLWAVDDRWIAWKRQHGVHYEEGDDDMLRRKIFDDNHAFIDRHNSRLASSRLRMNQFGALTVREFREQHLLPEGSWPPRQDIRGSAATTKQWAPATSPHQGLLPASVDWRNHSAVSNVSNQGGCGACYAFAAVGAMEGAWAIHGPNKELTPLSVQNIVDCSAPEGNMGCRAGSMVMSYNYTKVNKGIDSAASYPYTGKASACAFKAASVGATISDWEQVSGSTDGSAPVNISNVRTVPAMPLWFSLIMPRKSPCHRTVSELVLYPTASLHCTVRRHSLRLR